MQAARWFFISLPFVGLAWVILEIVLRDRRAMLEMVIDSEAFAKAPLPQVTTKKPAVTSTASTGLEVRGLKLLRDLQ
jgi:hypothetical protein